MPCAVAAPSTAAAQAGLQVSRAGGGAVDAAIAATVVAMATEPGIVSPLGGGFVTVWPTRGDPEVIDGNVEMPGRGLPRDRFGTGLRTVTMAYGGGVTTLGGHGSFATPGSFAALGEAHRRHGRLPWADVLAPAVAITQTGYQLGASAASYLAISGPALFGWDAQTAALLLDRDGAAHPAGTLIRDEALSASLQRVAERGARELYLGELGRAVAADCAERGGLVTAADLTAYRPVVRAALTSRLGDWTLATNPPPSIGGPLLTVMLTQLRDRPSLGWSDVIEIQQRVLRYRSEVHDLSEDLEEDGYTVLDLVASQGLDGLVLPPPTAASTAHVSVVDASGTACAVTMSSGYGSGATVPGTGLMLNNCLGEPELNRRGVHALPPGTRLASNMAPSVARSRRDDVLAVGSPGADRITTALMLVLWRHCLGAEPLAQAIDRPRLHVRVDAGEQPRLEYERDEDLAAAVAASALAATQHEPQSMYFGGVGAAARSGAGELSAAADPRRQGAVAVG